MYSNFGPIIFSLITGLVGFWLGHRLAIGRDRRREFNVAAAAFRDALAPEKILLDIRHAGDQYENKSAMEIIEPAIQRHTEAMIRFSPYLSWWKKIRFNRAWNQYAHFKVKGEPDTPYLAMYAEEKWDGKNTKDLAIKRIGKLIHFAKPQ
jgi:hypothetical protein